jgi:hypothetical protein
VAAREAAHKAGDTGEELHAMDYLVYAYLQSGRDADAAQVVDEVKAMPKLNTGEFKTGYAATAMPIRYLLERDRWNEAVAIVPPQKAPPHVTAIAIWARGIGLARSGHAGETAESITALQAIQEQLQGAGNQYWATQVDVMRREVAAWTYQAQGKQEQAAALLREAADKEDSVEKLPVTPGPITPAREQLGDLLLAQGHAELAAKEYQAALANAPGRARALRGSAECAKRIASRTVATQE